MFSLADQALIEAAIESLTATYDADSKTVRVGHMNHGAWMLFSKNERDELAVEGLASNIQYQEIITGVPGPSWQEVNAAWEVARRVFVDPSRVLPAVHRANSNRINSSIAGYLAMKDRVDRWGGFTGERQQLAATYRSLSLPEQRIVDERLSGKPVV